MEKLIICLATGLILFNQNSNNSVNHLLSVRFLVFFGLISYSLYLWHWVIFAQIRYVLMDDKIPYFVLIPVVLIAIGLSYLSYHFVEQPVRKTKQIPVSKFIFFLIYYFICAAYSLFFYFNRRDEYNPYKDNYYIWEYSNSCFDKIDLNICQKGDLSKQPQILVVGDSHAEHLSRFFDKVGKHEKWSAHIISAPSCLYIYQSNGIFTNYLSERESCSKVHQFVDSNLEKYSKIIFLQLWSFHDNKYSEFRERWIKSLSSLKNKDIYIFADTNYFINFLSPKRVKKYKKYINYPELELKTRNQSNNQIKEIIDKNFSNIHWVDINHLIPKDGKINGIFIYKDAGHFNPYGAEKLAEKFIESGAKLIQ